MKKQITILLAMVMAGPILPRAAAAESAATAAQAEIRLPAPDTTGGMSLTEALAKRRSVRSFTDKSLSKEQVSQLCWAAQGVTDEERGKRTAPSAMGLHGVVVFVVDNTGLYEYEPKPHALRRLEEGDMLAKLRAATTQPSVASAPFCMIVTMDIQRMKARSGDRAERYCLLESGHVAQNVLLQATALGLASVPVGGIDEARIAKPLKLPAQPRPVYLLPVGYPKAK